MSLCCHDNYTRTGRINISDVNILAAFQSWVDALGVTNESSQELDLANKEKFMEYYQSLVDKGTLPPLSRPVKDMPTDPHYGFDCSNFTAVT